MSNELYNSLYIVDNSNEQQNVKHYLTEWSKVSKQYDIATGYFEIGGLLEIDGFWQKVSKIRIILGSEVTKRTGKVFEEVVSFFTSALDGSIDSEKDKNEFLIGVPAILSALKERRIECRVYNKGKFHAKAYITHFTDEFYEQFLPEMNLPKGYALVGSSNFTKAGLTKNIELNVQFSEKVDVLQDWYEKQWNDSVDITDVILSIIEKHCKEYMPFDIYLRSMYEKFHNQDKTLSEWEETESKVYPLLSQYQKDGYNSLVQIAERYSGAFLCDGVGLGKTFVGMMIIERFVLKERKNVVLIVPAAARLSVWEATIKKYIPEILEGFYPFKIINHTDLLLEKNENLMDQIANQGEVVVIDEAHHFRNRSSNRYRKLFEMIGTGRKKQMFMLTATPINNSFLDLQHLIELFSQRKQDYFKDAPLGIHSLQGHFRKMEKALEAAANGTATDVNTEQSEAIFKSDQLVNELVVQRSRAYVKKSLTASESEKVLFPNRQPPVVANYDMRKSYGKLLDDFTASFYHKDKKSGKEKPLLALAVYSPYEEEYFKGDISKVDEMKRGRQTQVVNLIRQLLLKRFESSAAAFEETCIKIFFRLRKFLDDYIDVNRRQIERFYSRKENVLEYIDKYRTEIMSKSEEDLEDELPYYVWEIEENLNVSDFDIPVMISDTISDLEVLSDFIEDLMCIDSENDDKIKELIKIITDNEKTAGKKIIVFTEFRSTAQYIYRQLDKAGITGLFELDGQYSGNRKDIIERFAPYYNDKTSNDISDEINILISTDVLAEGLNLQDAACLINYELHWNPVRLMQRIGRVDRRRNQTVEDMLLSDHPELKADRENVYFWNFLPPKELENLLMLYKTVSQKTLRISKTFGIEGKKLLTPDDDYDALRDFNTAYEGTESDEEKVLLDYQRLMSEYPDYKDNIGTLPQKFFSGKLYDKKGIFFCYSLPEKLPDGSWKIKGGRTAWYYLDTETGNISDDVYEIWQIIKCDPEEKRAVAISPECFSAHKKKIENHINKTYLRSIQAPMGVKPELIAWMQLT